MAAAPNNTSAQLTADEIDDILYLTRTNDTAELLPYLTQLSQHHGTTTAVPILAACVDEYSGNTAFHYAAANGSTGKPSSSSSSSSPAPKKNPTNHENPAAI